MTRPMRSSEQSLRVLAHLLEGRREWHYGYAVSQATGLQSGTLYPILQRLADEGWLDTRWSESEQNGRPPRHLYKLTSAGAREAVQRTAAAAAAAPPTASRLRPARSAT